MPAFHLRAVFLPGGDAARDAWVVAGRLTFLPQDGAEPLTTGPAWVLPGLVDAHAHLAMDMAGRGLPPGDDLVAENLRAHLRAGTLLVRDPGSPRGEPLSWQGRAGVPRLQSAARFLAPEGRYLPIGQWTPAEALPGAAVAQVRAGARWVKVVADWPKFDRALGRPVAIANYDEATLRATVDAVHAAGGRVAVHATGFEAIRASVRAGVDSIEHGDELEEPLLAEMATRGLAWTPTLAMTEALAGAQRYTGEAHARFVRERYDRARQLLPVAARLGVPLLAGTDMLPHGSIAREVSALAGHGLAPAEALAAASTGARAFLGEPSLEDGAPADLVLYTADPRNDPESLASPALVMLGGAIQRF